MPNDAICLGSYMKSLTHLFTKIRDKDTKHCEFVQYANRLMSIICEEGIYIYIHTYILILLECKYV
jgi:uracil phosphoribosyltransferase